MSLDDLNPVPKVGDTVTIKLKIELDSGAKLQTQAMPLNIVDLPPEPTSSPTKAPSQSPTTGTPTTSPTSAPTNTPTASPTKAPSQSPTTGAPTNSPTFAPTKSPTATPSNSPSQSPTTGAPTTSPTPAPTKTPTLSPTKAPSQSPTTGAPTTTPTSTPTTSCTLPNKPRWLAIGTDGNLPCSETRTVNLGDTVTMLFFQEGANINNLDKLEVEFKVMGDKDRKTKWRIESDFFQTTDSNGHGRPHAFYDGSALRFRLDIPVDLIGDIGGTENGDKDPLTASELPGHIVWKWKTTLDGQNNQLDSGDNDALGVIHVL